MKEVGINKDVISNNTESVVCFFHAGKNRFFVASFKEILFISRPFIHSFKEEDNYYQASLQVKEVF